MRESRREIKVKIKQERWKNGWVGGFRRGLCQSISQ
jgi:hypothetical protein